MILWLIASEDPCRGGGEGAREPPQAALVGCCVARRIWRTRSVDIEDGQAAGSRSRGREW